MELNGVNNGNFYNLKFQDKIVITSTEHSVNDKVSIVKPQENINPPVSNISNTIKTSINNISLIQQTQKTLDQQSASIEHLSVITNNTTDINSKNTEINNIFKQYNNRGTQVYSNLYQLIEEQKSDKSHMYFDGVLGSIPISAEEINKASREQKELIEEINGKLESALQKENDYSKEIIEKQKMQEDLSFDKNNFKESDLKKLSLVLAYPAYTQDRSFSIRV